MSLCLLRRSFSIASKFRCNGVLRFKNQSTIPIIPPNAVSMPAIIYDYFRENLDRKSTIFWSVRSGSSPGINEATAATAAKRAVSAPSAANQSILSSAGIIVSMPLAGCQSKAEDSDRNVHQAAVMETAVTPLGYDSNSGYLGSGIHPVEGMVVVLVDVFFPSSVPRVPSSL